MLDHHQDMVAPGEKTFKRLQAVRSSNDKVLIKTTATYDAASISLAELQNTIETKTSFFLQVIGNYSNWGSQR